MAVQRFAQVFGVLYIVVGVLGFVPGVTTMSAGVGSFYGLIFGLFPVNAVHDIVHVLLGAWGLLASRSFEASRAFSRWLAFLLILLAILGWIPGPPSDLFGLAPIGPYDTWLHLASGIIAAYFGWGAAAKERSAA